MRPIARGEEVFIAYSHDGDYLTRSERLQGWFAECKCSRCVRDRKVSQARLQLRQRLGSVPQDIESIMDADSASSTKRKAFIAAAEEDLKRLRTTYTAEDKTQSAAAQILIRRLGNFHMLCYQRTGQ